MEERHTIEYLGCEFASMGKVPCKDFRIAHGIAVSALARGICKAVRIRSYILRGEVFVTHVTKEPVNEKKTVCKPHSIVGTTKLSI